MKKKLVTGLELITDRPTDQWTANSPYKGGWTHLKSVPQLFQAIHTFYL